MHVAAGFMPAFKYLQKNSLIVFERGRKARGYESAVDSSKNSNRLPAADDGAVRHFSRPNLDTSVVKEGWPRHQENAPIPLIGADGVVCSTSRSHLIDIRAAHRFNKERFAEIYKVASRQFEPPRLRAILETLMRADTPPYQGGEFPKTTPPKLSNPAKAG